MKKRRVVVNDRMQKNYVYYLTEPGGRNFDPDFLVVFDRAWMERHRARLFQPLQGDAEADASARRVRG